MNWVWIMLPLSLVIGYLRWRKGGRLFVAFQVGIGIAWIIYALIGFTSNGWHRPDLMGILLLAAGWTFSRLRDVRLAN